MNEPFKEGDIVWVKTTVSHAPPPDENGHQDMLLSSVTCWDTEHRGFDDIKRADYVERLEAMLVKAKEVISFYAEPKNWDTTGYSPGDNEDKIVLSYNCEDYERMPVKDTVIYCNGKHARDFLRENNNE